MHTISTRSSHFLENTLARFTTRERASAMLGDLLEMSESHSTSWFYVSFMRLLAATAWPRTIAWFGSYLVGCVFLYLAGNLWPQWRHTPHALPSLSVFSDSVGLLSILLVLPLSFSATYLACRYGVRDRMTQLAVTLAAVSILPFLLIPFPFLLLISGAFVLTLMLAALFTSTSRRALVILATSSISAGLLMMATFVLFTLIYPTTVFQHPYLRFAVVNGSGLIALCVFTSVSGWMHKRLFHKTEETQFA
jgi:hypothetical protein